MISRTSLDLGLEYKHRRDSRMGKRFDLCAFGLKVLRLSIEPGFRIGHPS